MALGVFDEVARAYPSSEYAAWSLAAKAAIEEAQKTRIDSATHGRKVPASFLTSLEIINRYPDSDAAERAYWTAGMEYEELKRWEQAADAYQQLGTRFPATELDACGERPRCSTGDSTASSRRSKPIDGYRRAQRTTKTRRSGSAD